MQFTSILGDLSTNMLPNRLRYCVFNLQRTFKLPSVVKLFEYENKAITIFVKVKQVV